MDGEIIKVVGGVAGIGGLALGVFLLLFRDVVRKAIFPMLTKDQAYRLLRLIVVLVFVIAAWGIGAWVLTGNSGGGVAGDRIDATNSVVNTGTMNAPASVTVQGGAGAR